MEETKQATDGMTAEDRSAIAREVAEAILPMVLSEMDRIAASQSSPWRNRRMAAAYLQSSVAVVDNIFAQGRAKKHFVGSTPLIRVEDLERIVAEDTERKKHAPRKQSGDPGGTVPRMRRVRSAN